MTNSNPTTQGFLVVNKFTSETGDIFIIERYTRVDTCIQSNLRLFTDNKISERLSCERQCLSRMWGSCMHPDNASVGIDK